MKKKSLWAAVMILLIAACQSKTSQTQNFIPGTYVNFTKGDYAIAYDTLVITQMDDAHYLITRKTTYQAIRDGKILPKRHKVKKLDAVWDSGKQELDETTTGRVFRFDKDKRVLMIHQAVYRKIN